MVLESNPEEKAGLVEISKEARSLYEEMERLKEDAEVSGDAMDELGKILTIARRTQTEIKFQVLMKKLMEYNSDHIRPPRQLHY